MRKVRAGAYLASVAASRALYRLLLEDALSLLPTSPNGKPERVETFMSLAAIVRTLKVSRSTVQGDMRRLENYGWVVEREPRLLGHREGSEVFLIADDAARDATGEALVVSRLVVADIVTPKPMDPQPDPRAEWRGRGGDRASCYREQR